jgi:membrane protease YdiL (CAAX protease family)
MVPAVMVVGLLAEMVAWGTVARRRRSVWPVMAATLAAMGVAAALVGSPPLSTSVPAARAVAVGAGSGVVLYLATRVFVMVVHGWRRFQRHGSRMYARQAGLPLWAALVLSLAVMVVGEELFWRGLFQLRLGRGLDSHLAGAVLSWLVFVAANLPSANLAIVAGAVVGGAVWTGLAWWSHGFLASMTSHVMWTGLMLSAPVLAAQEGA